MRKVILFLAIVWVVIYSNARMLEYVPTYKLVHLFPIPQPVRFLELLIVTFLYAISLSTKMNRVVLLVNLCILTFLSIAVGTLVLQRNITLAGIQDIYIRVVPFLLFVVIAQARRATRQELMFVVKFLTIALLLSIIIALVYQIPFYGYYEDNINGFFEDAHMFGNYLAVFSIVLFFDYLNYKRKISLVVSIGLLGLSVYPSNEKVVLLNALLIVCAFIYYLISRARTFLGKFAIIGGLLILSSAGALYLQKAKGEELWSRANIVVNVIGIENVGPVLAWPMAVNEIKGNVFSLFFGLGSGEYGWIAASKNVAEGGGSVHSRLFEFEFSNDNVNNAGFLFRTNTWSSLLAEYGIIGFSAFLTALFLIAWSVKKYQPVSRLEKNLKTAFFATLLIVVFQGFFTPYSNWSASALLFPMMYFAAYFQKPAFDHVKEEQERYAENEPPPLTTAG